MSSSDEEFEAHLRQMVKRPAVKETEGKPVQVAKKTPVATTFPPENQPGPSTSSALVALQPLGKRKVPVKQVAAPAVKKDLQLIDENVSGRIKSFHVFRGWGFIKMTEEGTKPLEEGEVDSDDDIFFRNKDLNEESAAGARLQAGKLAKCITLKVDQMVVFDLCQDATSGKLQALDVRGKDGGLLQPDQAWVVKTDRDNLTKQISKLSMRVEKLAAEKKEEKKAETKEKKKEEEAGLCILCKEEPANMMFVPCNHVAACEKCYKANTSKFRGQCMICRRPVGYLPSVAAPGRGSVRSYSVEPAVKVFMP